MMSARAKREVADRVSALVEARFGGSYRDAFGHYRLDCQGRVDWAGLAALLVDAGAVNLSTRAAWAGELIIDADQGGDVWAPLAAALGGCLIPAGARGDQAVRTADRAHPRKSGATARSRTPVGE
ncbi:MAG: hypothetical protein JWO38_3545 [Gemmataceae bacterium]|nr:hypothetical protein [Gemmataceae bacterium]